MANHTPQGSLVAFALKNFPTVPRGETLGLIKRLLGKWPLREVEAMVKGAAIMGWSNLRSVSSKEGLGRRWAMAAYWQSLNKRGGQVPEVIRAVMRGMT